MKIWLGSISAMLEQMSAKPERPARTARVRERGIELYAEAGTRQRISTPNLSEALRTFLEAQEAEGYLAVINYAGSKPESDAALGRLREQLAERLGIPVSLSAGP